MKILGIGVDIVENERIQKSIKNPLFKKRIYSFKELKQSNAVDNKVAFFSKRFAAKEAFSKALGTGFRMNLNFKDIEVINDKMGKPYYVKNRKITKIIQKNFKIKKSIKNSLFKKRIYSSKELKQSNGVNNKVAYFSKRFAAKEAFSKALGIGFRMNLNFKDIEVVNDKKGKPYYVKNKKITKMVQKNFKIKNFKFFLSISDEKNYSTAFVIIQTS